MHTCTSALDVEFTSGLERLVIYEPADEEASEFDAWVHAQLLSAAGHYNRL